MKLFKKGNPQKAIRHSVLTLGNFDGMHRGHRKILDSIVKRARALGVPAVVYTFEPHPLKVVAPHRSPQLLFDIEDKVRLIEEAGVDCLVLARFTKDFAARHPREFVEKEIASKEVGEVWVGHDFSFGRAKTGTVEYLKELGSEFGFKVFVAPAYRRGNAVVSSSRIRGLISNGDVTGAAALLGRRYSIKGRVVKGRRVGNLLGFPTANLRITSELLPGDGVYAGFAVARGKKFAAAISVGSAPTFGKNARCVEAHILDFKGKLYGKKIEAVFVKRLRDVMTFSSGEALVSQIEKDVRKVRSVIGKISG